MNKYTDKELDEALAMLNTNGVITPIHYPDENEKVRLDGVFRHLAALGFIKLHEAGYISGVLLLSKGLSFINDGGFHAKRIKEDKDEYIKNLQTKNLELSNINLKFENENAELKAENIRLSNSEYKYKRSMRFWQCVATGLAIAELITGYFALFR